MKIQICTMVLSYQRRYWWQLSSLLQQVPHRDDTGAGWAVPTIIPQMSVTRRDPYWEWNERLKAIFGDWLKVDEWAADDETFGRRGHIRSKNIQDCPEDVDWLLFNDGDQVYHPEFFAHLGGLLHHHQDEHRVLATYRDSMSFEDGYRLVRSEAYDGPVLSAFARATSVKTWPASRHRISGAGFFQLINMRVLRKRIAEENPDLQYYVDPGYNKDHNTFNQNHITRSDRNFRVRMGGIVAIYCKPQIHLNHYRKNDPQYPDEVH